MSMPIDAIRLPDGPQQGAHIAEGRLAGRPGVGTLQVWRGQHGEKLEYAGTWRRELDDGAREEDAEALEAALEEGRQVEFDGRLDDPERSGRDHVTVPVEIRSLGRYPYLIDPRDPRSPTVEVLIVNFRPVQELGEG